MQNGGLWKVTTLRFQGRRWPRHGATSNSLLLRASPWSTILSTTGNARIENVGKSQSCMVYKVRIVDNRATSGVVSRWNLVHHLMKKPVIYDERKEQMRRTIICARINM